MPRAENAKKILKKALPWILGLTMWIGASLITGTACWFQSFIGVPCPGCGSTRAAMELFHGHWGEAMRWHPLIPVSLTILPASVILWIFGKEKTAVNRLVKAASAVLLVAYVAVYTVRMIWWFPHTEPMVPLKTALWRQALALIMKLF